MIAAITGANGFIGHHLVRHFGDAGWDTRGITRRDVELGRLEESLRGADIIVHAAGATRAPTAVGLNSSNVELTARILEAARAARVQRFLFVSSLAAIGPASSREHPVSEATLARPIEAYGRSKLAAEQLVESSDVPFTIVRPAAVYGPRDRDFLALFRLARRGIALHPSNREHWISIVHVDDVADAIVRSASTTAAGRVYCLGSDEPVQWAELFRLAAACAGRTLSFDVDLPSALVSIGAKLGDIAAQLTGRASLLTSEKLALSKARYWTCSSALAERDLAWTPRTPLTQGLCETFRWYVENGWL